MRILLDNALRHTPAGTHVTVRADRSNGAAGLTVADAGPGLPDGSRAKVFERFYTGDAARGAGLGLAIARELAERMDGRLRVRVPAGRHRVHARASSRRERRVTRACAVLLAAIGLVAAGCDSATTTSPRARPREVTTTRVQVVEGIGREGGFDPDQIYERLSPGVVTILSIFEGGASLLDEDGEGGQGSGFVLDGEGYIATNAHVVTTGESPRSERAEDVFVEFSDGNRVPAEIVGRRPQRRRRAAEGRPRRPEAHAARLGSSDSIQVGEPVAAIGSPFGERAVALDRRDLGASTATSSRSPASRSATRSRRTPPSTPATRAARCSTRAAG